MLSYVARIFWGTDFERVILAMLSYRWKFTTRLCSLPATLRASRLCIRCFDLAEGLGHAVEAELVQQIERWMGEKSGLS